MNYSELATAIQDYCQNSEDSFVSHINEFIISAEDTTFQALQGSLYFKDFFGFSTAAGKSDYTAADGLPDGIVDVQGIRLGETAGGTVNNSGTYRYLLIKDYDFLWDAYPSVPAGPVQGIPKYYAVKQSFSILGELNMTISLFPHPDDVYPLSIEYFGKPNDGSITYGNTPLVASTDTTWISIMLPDVLLYGALVQAYTYMKGEADVMQGYQKQFGESLLLLKNMVEKRQTTDTYKANDEGAQ